MELVKEDVLKYSVESYTFKSLELIEQEFKLELKSLDLATTISIIKGVERALIVGNIDGKLDMNYFDINVNLVKCALLYLGIDRGVINENVTVVRKKMLEKKIDFTVFDGEIADEH